jgi:predicted dehydrogenase
MNQVRFGIIGVGGVSRLAYLPRLSTHPKATLVAVADVSREAVDRAMADYNVPFGYTDYLEMIERENLDAVAVCTPNKFHAPISINALNKGLHVLCEKPMALNPAECRDMMQAAEASGKTLGIAYRYRHKPTSQAAKRVIESGELGEIYAVRVQGLRRRGIPSWGVFTNKELQGGGALVDFGVHLLDLALWLVGNPRLVEVMGTTSQRIGSRPNVNIWGPWNHEAFTVEDQAMAMIRLENGGAIQLEVSWALNIPASVENISISGTEGGLELQPFSINKAAHGMLLDMTPNWMPNEQRVDWESQFDDFIDALLEGRQPLVKPEEALKVSELVDAIYRSAESRQAVQLGEGSA